MQNQIGRRLIGLSLLGAVTACATLPRGGAPTSAALAPGMRVRAWVGTPSRLDWRMGWLLALTADSLVMERTDILGRPRLALPVDSIRRLEVHRNGRDRASASGCLIGGVVVAVLGSMGESTASEGLGARFVLAGAGFGCAIGILVGAFVGDSGEWETVSVLRGGPPP